MIDRHIASAFLCLGLFAAAGSAQTITFVDEQGAPATTLLDGGAVRVRVTDSSANTGPGRDAVSAVVTSVLGGDSETVSLLETGLDTGVFEGWVDLIAQVSSWGPGLLTAVDPGPPPTRDTLHATYPATGATATAGLVTGFISYLDAWGRESTSFVAGDKVRLRVRSKWYDAEENQGYLPLLLSSQTGGDSEHSPFIRETGLNTGVFEMELPTTRSPSSSNSGRLGVAVGDTVTATIAYDPMSPSTQAQTTGSLVVLLDANGKPAETFAETSRLRIRVIDPAASDPVSIQVTAAQSGDVETVLLSAAGQGFYEGEIDARPIPHNTPSSGDGILQHSKVWGWPSLQMDTVTASYARSGGTVSDSAGFVLGRIAFLDPQGEVVSSYASGSEVTVRLELPMSNGNPSSVDQTAIILFGPSGGDFEYKPVFETGPDSGIFTGSMPLRSTPVSPFDQVLSAEPGDQIGAAWESISVLHATANVTDLSLAIVDEQGDPAKEVLSGGEARVRMLNLFANTDPENAESVEVETRSRHTGDLEALVLTETGPDTSVFEGSIGLETGYLASDGVLQTADSGSPGYRPDEIMVRSGLHEATARVFRARIEFVDADGIETAGYSAGETVRLRITDPLSALSGNSFTIKAVTLPTLSLGIDHEIVTMVKTAPGSEVFEGSIPTVLEEASLDPDGHLDVLEIRRVEFSHPGGLLAGKAQVSIFNSDHPNRVPEPLPDYASTTEDQPVTIFVLDNDTDPDGDLLRVVGVTVTTGTAVIDPGGETVTYTPEPNAFGKVGLQVTVRDPEGLEASSEGGVSILPVNDPPVAVDDEATTPEDTQVVIDLRANDSDIDSEVYYPSSVTDPAHGTVQHGPSGARYTPDPGFTGVDTFSYILVDGEGATDMATVTVTVTPVTPPRVTTGLQVLYELEEGSGTTVADTSGVGTPLNLTIGNASAVTWIPGGLSIDSPTLIQSATAAAKVISAIKSTHSVTLEAWVEPANTTQSGPAPVVTVSQTSAIRNFTLGQNGNRWETRVRTSNTNPTGYGHNTPVGSATLGLTHVVYTRDAANPVKLYINGVQVLNGYVTGTFATWPANQKLGLAAELNGANPWLGKLYLVAVYNRALTTAEVQQNWEAGE